MMPEDAAPTAEPPAADTTQQQQPTTPPAGADPNAVKADNDSLSAPNPANDGYNFLRTLNDENQQKATLQKFKSVDDLAKSYVELESAFRNRDIQKKPDEHSTPEQIKAWRDHLGVPETVAGYEIPEGLKSMSQEELNDVFGDAGYSPVIGGLHQLHLNQEQLTGVVNMFGQLISNMADMHEAAELQAKEEAKSLAEKALRDEWEGNFESNLNQYKDWVGNFDGLFDFLKAKGLDNDPETIKMFHSMLSSHGIGS